EEEEARQQEIKNGFFEYLADGDVQLRIFAGFEDLSFEEFQAHWEHQNPKPITVEEFNSIRTLFVLIRNRLLSIRMRNSKSVETDYEVIKEAMDKNDQSHETQVRRDFGTVVATTNNGVPVLRFVLPGREDA